MSYKEGSVDVQNSSGEKTDYKFELVPAMTNKEDEITVTVEEETSFNEPVPLSVTNQNKPIVSLYPSITKQLDIKMTNNELNIPEGCKPLGKINFESTSTNKIENELTIIFNF